MSRPDAVARLAAERVAELRHEIDYLLRPEELVVGVVGWRVGEVVFVGGGLGRVGFRW